MAHTRAWRNFKRTQDLTVASAALIYAGAVLHAFDRLPAPLMITLQFTLVWPGLLALLSMGVPLIVGALRRWLIRYVWMSFQAGFGQTVASILAGVGLLGGAALFMYLQIAAAARGGPYPSAVFAGYAAGIGILIAQAALVRVLEKLPEVQKEIEE